MIILIAPEVTVKNEIKILHQLFEAGLAYYHFRKPQFSFEQHCKYLNEIDSQYHSRIVTHYYHNLIEKFDLKGVHLQEQVRIDLNSRLEKYVQSYQSKGISVSSSFHEPEDIENCNTKFNYHLLSPVFSSISKQGYLGRGFDVTNSSKKIIGMGGINASTIKETLASGFKGIGVLGGVWNSEQPIDSFKNIKHHYKENKNLHYEKL